MLVGIVKGCAKVGWSGGGGSAAGIDAGGNFSNGEGSVVALTAGNSVDACDAREARWSAISGEFVQALKLRNYRVLGRVCCQIVAGRHQEFTP